MTRTRRVVLLVGVLIVLGLGGYAAYRSPWVRSWFARDSENAAEMERLAQKKLESQPVAAADAGWFQWRGPTRDGRAPDGPFRTDWNTNPPKRLWSSPCGGGYSSCAVVGGRVYTQDRQGTDERVLCLDADSGQLLWQYAYPADYTGLDYAAGPRATPTVVGNRVYTVGAVGKFLCLEPPAGPGGQPRLVWQHNLMDEFGARVPQWGVACSPLIEGDLVIVQPGGRNGSVVAFSKDTGEVRWTAGKNPSGYSSPVAATVGGKRVIFAMTGDALLAIRPTDGTVTDSYDWVTQYKGNVATPLVVDEYVFISSAYRKGCALLRAELRGDDCKLVEVYARLRPPGLKNHHCSSVYKDRHVFGFDGDTTAFLKCVNLDTGKDVWDAERQVGKGSLILAGNHLIIQTERGELCLVEATPTDFRLVAKLPQVLTGNNSWATPTLVHGRLYLRDDEKVVCYDVRPTQ